MLKSTAGQILVNDLLPPDLRSYGRVYDQKGLDEVIDSLAHNHPEKYREVTKKLNDLGVEVAVRKGGLTFGLEHIFRPAAAEALSKEIKDKSDLIYADPRLNDSQRRERITDLLAQYQDKMTQASYGEALKAGNPLAVQAAMGFRGNKSSIRSLLGSDLAYADLKGKTIPYPILRSYSQGLTPAEYWASTYGARQGVLALKMATADAGALGKQISQSAHHLVTTRGADDEDWHDGKTIRGLPMSVDDSGNVGSVLAQDTGKFKRNSVITPAVLADLKADGHDQILVRSPLVGGTPEGGLHALDLGIRDKGRLAGRGEFVGIAAAQALGEPLSQLQLSMKHTGGVAGAQKVGGFKLIEALANPPKAFPGGAAHAQVDGTVDSIEPAVAGGHDVWIGGQRHHVLHGYELRVKKGQSVEAGDTLSNGFPNPREIVANKGIGEGRRYLTNALMAAYKENGLRTQRRNVELVARGLVDHVRFVDPYEEHLPGDVANYSGVESSWQPRSGFQVVPASKAVGKYIESPVLHHTIGTRVRPSMLPEFKRFGVDNLIVHEDPPPFRPEMFRALDNLQHSKDWQVRLGGQYLQKGILDAAHRGLSSSERNTSFIPALMHGSDIAKSLPTPAKAARADNSGDHTEGVAPRAIISVQRDFRITVFRMPEKDAQPSSRNKEDDLKKTNRPRVVAVDLDGTLASKETPFNPASIGPLRPRARKIMEAIKDAGAKIIVHTVRGNTALVEKWLKEHDLPYDHVNHNPWQPPDSSSKLYADVILDDKAVDSRNLDLAGKEVLERLKQAIAWECLTAEERSLVGVDS